MSLFRRVWHWVRAALGIDWIRETRIIADEARQTRYEATGNPLADAYRGVYSSEGEDRG